MVNIWPFLLLNLGYFTAFHAYLGGMGVRYRRLQDKIARGEQQYADIAQQLQAISAEYVPGLQAENERRFREGQYG